MDNNSATPSYFQAIGHLAAHDVETLALLTRTRLDYCEEQDSPEYEVEAEGLRDLLASLDPEPDCRNCGGDGFSCEGGECPACKGGE